MGIHKPAVAGILEPSDCQVTVEPEEENIEFMLESTVINQYGNQTKKVVIETLGNLGVKDMRIAIVDRDALDCATRARVEDAVFHAAGRHDNLPWGGAIR